MGWSQEPEPARLLCRPAASTHQLLKRPRTPGGTNGTNKLDRFVVFRLGRFATSAALGKSRAFRNSDNCFSSRDVCVLLTKHPGESCKKTSSYRFFLKTEMDPAMRLAYQKYKDALEASKKSPSIEQFKQSEPDKYWEIRTYLDINELICIGVNEKVFHQRVCYGFWYNILRFSVTDGREVIEHARGQEGDERTYDEILNVSTRWLGTRRPWQLWRSRRSREKNAAR
jgi:hypothetical protein